MDKKHWAREIKIAQKLFDSFSSPPFWDYVIPLLPKAKSLSRFLTEPWQYDISKYHEKFLQEVLEFPATETVQLNVEKVGEDKTNTTVLSPASKMTLLELLKKK